MDGQRASPDGLPFTLTRENRFAVTQFPNREFLDISVASIDELARDLEALYANRFTEVSNHQSQMNADVAVRPRRLQLEALERETAPSGCQSIRAPASRPPPASR